MHFKVFQVSMIVFGYHGIWLHLGVSSRGISEYSEEFGMFFGHFENSNHGLRGYLVVFLNVPVINSNFCAVLLTVQVPACFDIFLTNMWSKLIKFVVQYLLNLFCSKLEELRILDIFKSFGT